MVITQKPQPFISTGGFGQLLVLFYPILAITFSNCLYLFVEKLLLAGLSVKAMAAAVSASYAIQIFQLPCIALAMMAQVFVGHWYGANKWSVIGPGIWQFIWFSFLSMLITIPFSYFYGDWYFSGTDIEGIVFPYFYFLTSINFLFPLGAALSCFYLGQGKTRLVLFATLGSQVMKLLLAYLFIFGWGSWLPAWGIMGGALSTLIVQGGFCLLLLWMFLRPKCAEIYHSREWHFRLELFWECIYPGLLRAGNRILCALSWASIAHLMTAKGGDYLLILSIGGTLFFFLPFLGEAICQAQTTVVSNILGSGKYHLMNQAFRSGTLLVVVTIILLGVPFLFFPYQIFRELFPEIVLNEKAINQLFLGIWVSFACFTYCFLLISYTLAFKDTKFSFFMGAFSWVNGYLLMYLAIEMIGIPADQFWLVLALMHGSSALLYFWRMKVKEQLMEMIEVLNY